MKYLLSFLLLLPAVFPASGQRTEYPLTGAQVFIEPGQSAEEIDGFFRTLAQNGMQVARIRMFGAHMLRNDAAPDFTLYDTAFDAAHRHGIRLFATLFPPTDELNDVGGFKFPRSKAHLEEVRRYIRTIVSHFAAKPALYAWVLQNEPGTGGHSVRATDLSDSVRQIWSGNRQTETPRDGYLKVDFSDEEFLKYYTKWYLNWIADQVRQADTGHYLHINPHALLSNLPEYDFRGYEQFLSSLGVSMHLSWHFGDFTRQQYPLGVAMMCDIIREKAGRNPFWITELQGGNVTASGYVPLCPSAQEISQYMWTGIASGCEGNIFWTLNARRSVMEAGEWALLDYQGAPSDRLEAAAGVARTIQTNRLLFSGAKPADSPLTILYNEESLTIQRRNSEVVKDSAHEGRKASAVIRSIIAAYEAIAAHGMTPNLSSMGYFDWDPSKHPVAIVPNCVSLPHKYHRPMAEFVRNGGKLIVTGLSGYYDENMSCLMMGEFPLAECFGGSISEFKVTDDYFDLSLCGGLKGTVPAHLWRGIIKPSTAECIARYGGDICATRNSYGKGEVYWIPSPIHLGSYRRDNSRLVELYGTLCGDAIAREPVRFKTPEQGILLRVTETPDATIAYVVNTNTSGRNRKIRFVTPPALKNARLAGNHGSELNGNTLRIPAGETAICTWDKKRSPDTVADT